MISLTVNQRFQDHTLPPLLSRKTRCLRHKYLKKKIRFFGPSRVEYSLKQIYLLPNISKGKKNL